MTLELPDISGILEKLMPLESSFDSRTQPIEEWIKEQRNQIIKNLALIQRPSDENDMKVLLIFFRELLMRNIVGEAGERLHRSLCEIVKTKDDLTQENYERALEQADYRWGKSTGSSVMTAVVAYFRDELNWNWQKYLRQAEQEKELNFFTDPLRKIKYVGPKVRDLALSNFNNNYAAFDLHVIRVVSRIGLMACGWDLTKDAGVDFGTNPSDEKNYLFFRRLFLKLASLSRGFTPVDLDRTFWHLGRRVCGNTTDCASCPIHDVCLTGKHRKQTTPRLRENPGRARFTP
jgi:hypothetical protein